jgi:hypothetical protein
MGKTIVTQAAKYQVYIVWQFVNNACRTVTENARFIVIWSKTAVCSGDYCRYFCLFGMAAHVIISCDG